MKLPIKGNVIPFESGSITLEEIAEISIRKLRGMSLLEKDEMNKTTLIMAAFALEEFLK